VPKKENQSGDSRRTPRADLECGENRRFGFFSNGAAGEEIASKQERQLPPIA
jgi:hypothetical protein